MNIQSECEELYFKIQCTDCSLVKLNFDRVLETSGIKYGNTRGMTYFKLKLVHEIVHEPLFGFDIFTSTF